MTTVSCETVQPTPISAKLNWPSGSTTPVAVMLHTHPFVTERILVDICHEDDGATWSVPETALTTLQRGASFLNGDLVVNRWFYTVRLLITGESQPGNPEPVSVEVELPRIELERQMAKPLPQFPKLTEITISDGSGPRRNKRTARIALRSNPTRPNAILLQLFDDTSGIPDTWQLTRTGIMLASWFRHPRSDAGVTTLPGRWGKINLVLNTYDNSKPVHIKLPRNIVRSLITAGHFA